MANFWENAPVVSGGEPATDEGDWWQKSPIVQGSGEKPTIPSAVQDVIDQTSAQAEIEAGAGEAQTRSSMSEPQPKKADALDLFNYQVADKTNSALQGLFRTLAQTGLPEAWRFDDMADAMEKHRLKLSDYFGVKPDDLKSATGKITGAAANVFDAAPGPAVMITKMAAETYGNGFRESADRQRQAGETDETKITEKARSDGMDAVESTAPVMLFYAATGPVARAGARTILPEAAGPLARAIVGAGTAGVANYSVSSIVRAAEGQPVEGDLKQNLTDIFFGALGGVHAAEAPGQTRKGGVTDAETKSKESAGAGAEEGSNAPGSIVSPQESGGEGPQGSQSQTAPERQSGTQGGGIGGAGSAVAEPATGRAESGSAASGIDTQTQVSGFPVAAIPTSQIAVRPELMQFKAMNDTATGENAHDQITAPYDPLKAGTLLLWQPNNPQEYGLDQNQKYIVANGHHRHAAASEQTVQTQNAQILRESAGYSAGDARTIAAEANIADGKGTIYDQAKFIRNVAATHGPDAALARAGQIGARGRKAATIALAAEPDLYASFINEQVTPDAAANIANVAPNDAPLQRLGIQRALGGETPEEVSNFLQAVKAKIGSSPSAKQIDLFGADDAAIKEAERAAKRAGAIQRELGEQINAVLGASKRPEKAAALGVNVQDPEALKTALVNLQGLRDRAKNWALDSQIRDMAIRGDYSPAEAIKQLQGQPAGPTESYSGASTGAHVPQSEAQSIVAETPGEILPRYVSGSDVSDFKRKAGNARITRAENLRTGDVIIAENAPGTRHLVKTVERIERDPVTPSEGWIRFNDGTGLRTALDQSKFDVYERGGRPVSRAAGELLARAKSETQENILPRREAQAESTRVQEQPALDFEGKLKAAEAKARLRAGEKQGDLFQGQDAPFNLAGESGVDWEARQREAETKAEADAAARAEADKQQQNLFKPGAQPQTLPRVIRPQLTPNGAPVLSESQIREYLSKSLDIPVRAGMRVAGGLKGALGVFRVKPETIRTKLRNDIPTIAHEVGHYIHHLIFTDANGRPSQFAQQFDGELLPLGRPTSGPNYSTAQVRMEGVAEFMSKWLTDNPAAIAAAPHFSSFFESELKTKFPQTWDIVSNARDMVQRLLAQPGWERAKTRIEFNYEQPRAPFRQWLSRKYAEWFNELAPIDKAMRTLTSFGLAPDIARQVSDRAINYKGGWRGKADFDLEFDQQNLEGNRVGPGLKKILGGLAPKELGDFSTYIALMRAKEKAAQGIRTGFEPELRDPETWKKMNALAPRYEVKRQQLIKYSDNLLSLLKESGLFTERQLSGMRALNKDYVPFYRIYEGVGGARALKGTAHAGGFVNTSSGVLRMKGSDRAIVDPLESIIKNTYAFRDIAERNRVGREFVDAVLKTQGGGRVGETMIRPVKPVRVLAEEVEQKLRDVGMDPDDVKRLSQERDLSMTIFRASNGVNARDGVFRVWKDGQERLFQIDDRDLLRALALSDTIDASTVKLIPGFRPLAAITRFLRVGATLTPEFIARNPFRDQITAAVFSRYNFVPFVDGFRGMLSALGQDKWYQQWVKEGGRYSGLYDIEGHSTHDILAKVIRDPNALQQALDLVNPKNALKNLAAASSLMEEATRISEFRRGIESGGTGLQAANASKDVTLNFSRSGIKGKILNQVVAFFNAGMQDVDKMMRAHREAPVRTATKAMLYITLPSILTWAAGKDDEKIQNLPEWRKDFFWNVNLGGRVFSFPKPFLLGALYGTSVEKALDYLNGKDPNALKKALYAIYQSGSPARGDMIAATNAFKPLVENMTNYSFFTQRPLVSDTQKGLSPAIQFTPATSETSKLVGKILGIAPIKIDNLIRGYFGGLGRYATDGIDWVLLRAQGRDVPAAPTKDISQYPLAKGFMQPPYEPSEYVQRFYRALGNAETRLNDFRTYSERLDTPGMHDFLRKNKNELVWYNASTDEADATVMTELRRARDYMADIDKALVMVQNSKRIDADAKAHKLSQLTQVRNKLAETAFKTFVHPTDRADVF